MTNVRRLVNYFLVVAIITPTLLLGAVTMQSIKGVWTSKTGGKNVTGLNTPTLSWGAKTKYRSAYNFTPVKPAIFNVVLGTPFNLGTFTHINKLIPINTAITSATLTTSLKLKIDGTTQNLSFNFNFLHNETPNLSSVCPPLGLCDDIVTLTNNSLSTHEFIVNGVTYEFKLLGFFINNQLFTSFHTKEKMSNSAILKAEIIKKEIPVPEPATYLILSSVLLGCVYLKLRKTRLVKE